MISPGFNVPRRWLAYFDILGFGDLVKGNHPIITVLTIHRALDEAKKKAKVREDISIEMVHFSDSFIFYAPDDSNVSYVLLQSVARGFFSACLKAYPFIPLRGAIACGEFYADPSERIYFGKALIKAYKEAERQNWIGLILTEAAERRVCDEYDLNPVGHRFQLVDVPIKNDETVKRQAYSFHAEWPENRIVINSIISKLEYEMAEVEEEHKIKYQNTINHINYITEYRYITRCYESAQTDQ